MFSKSQKLNINSGILLIQNKINNMGFDRSQSVCYMPSVQEAIALQEIKKIATEHKIFFYSKKDLHEVFDKLGGPPVIYYLRNAYEFATKNHKTLLRKAVKESLIEGIDFYIQDRKQIFIDMKKMISILKSFGMDIRKKEFIKLEGRIWDYEAQKERNHSFKSVQSFKKWLKRYIPCDISCIQVKKQGNKYLVSCTYSISIPYNVISIKRLDVEMINIDTEHHIYHKNYEIVDYREKELQGIDSELQRLKKLL